VILATYFFVVFINFVKILGSPFVDVSYESFWCRLKLLFIEL